MSFLAQTIGQIFKVEFCPFLLFLAFFTLKSDPNYLHFKFPDLILYQAYAQRYLLPVEAYLCTEELMQKRLSLVAIFWKEVNFSSRNLVKIHWWQNNFFCVADVMVSTKALTQEKSLFWLSHFSLCLLCHHIILARFREN